MKQKKKTKAMCHHLPSSDAMPPQTQGGIPSPGRPGAPAGIAPIPPRGVRGVQGIGENPAEAGPFPVP